MSIIASVGNGIRLAAAAAGRGAQNIGSSVVGVGRGLSMVFVRGSRWGAQSFWQRTRIDFMREVGDGSSNSAVVATIGWIARNFPEAPVRVAKLNADGTSDYIIEGPTGPGFMLRLLEAPNTFYSGVVLWMATIIDWFTDGNGYWYKERLQDGPFKGRVIRLWWLPARTMTPRGDESSFISWYDYNPNGTILQLDPDDVVHFRDSLDPNDPRRGRSPLASLLREIYTDDEAANFTAQLLTNVGVPGVVLSPSNTNTGGIRADPNAVKQAFKDKFGGDKRGDPLIFTSPTDVKVLSWSPEQMNLRSLRQIPEERISSVIGVSPMVTGLGAGLEHSSFTNYGDARAAGYEETIIPKQRVASSLLKVQLLDEFVDITAGGWIVDFDISNVRAMQGYFADTWKRFADAASKGLLTRGTFKKAVNQPVLAGDDVYIIASNYVILDAQDGSVQRLGSPPPVVPGDQSSPGTVPPAKEPVAPEPAPAKPTKGPAKGALAAITPIAEARCPEPDCNKLLGYEVTSGRLWCSRCKAERAFGTAA